MSAEPVRLGGMALANGVLVHGPRTWACAIRTDRGELRVASATKSVRSADVRSPFLRAPARIVEALAVLPAVQRALPEARLPFLEPRVLGLMAGAALVARKLRGSGLSAGAQEAVGVALAVVPAALALRGTEVAEYHGAEHISIGTYEHGEARPRQHERCGSHMLGPLLVSTAAGNVLVSRLPGPPGRRAAARLGVGVASLALAGEAFGWMLRHPTNPVSRLLSWPGHELQSRFLTADPTSAQLEVARAALTECLRAEWAAEDE